MKILHINMGHPEHPVFFGGAEIRNRKIYEFLSNKGHDITILSPKIGNTYTQIINKNMRYVFVGLSCNNHSILEKVKVSIVFSMVSFLWIIRHYKTFDIIIEELCPWSPSFSFILKNRPVVLQIQGYASWRDYVRRNGRVIGTLLYLNSLLYPKFFNKWIVISDSLNHRYHISGEVISQGVDELMIREAKQMSGSYVGFLGRLDIHQKGLDILLDAIELLKDEGIKFILAGDGRDRNVILKTIFEKGLSNVVDMIGWVDGFDKLRFISNARLLVLPSRFEGQSIVSIESAACWKPIVVSNIPELSHVIQHGFGISFDVFNGESLAKAIKTLYYNDDMITGMGKKAREFALYHTWGKVVEKYEKALEKFITFMRSVAC